MLDVSTRIVVSLFDYLGYKDISFDQVLNMIGDQHDRAILIPDSMRVDPGYVSSDLFEDLLKAFVQVLQNPDWAKDFVNYSIIHDAPWIVPIRSAAATLTTPFHFYNFIVNWYPKIEFPFLSTSLTQDHDKFVVVVSIPDRSSKDPIFDLLEELFIQAPKVIGLPESMVSSSDAGNQRAFEILVTNGNSKWGQFATRLKNLFNGDQNKSTVQNFYLQLAKGYEDLLKERAGFYEKNRNLESRIKSQSSEIGHVRGEVLEHQAFLQAIFENIDAIVYLTDKNGDVLSASDRYYHMLRSNEVTGNSAQSIINELSELVANVYRTGVKSESEYSFQQENAEKTYAIKSSPVHNSSGKIIACVCVGIDITKQKTLDVITSESMKGLEINSRVRSMFVSNVSHELRTPLTSILGFVELLQAGEVPKEKKQIYLGIIKSNGQLLLGLINNLLDIAKIESGHKILESVPIDSRQCFDELRDSISGPVLDKNLEFNFEVAATVPARIYSDPARIKQVLGHLVDNSLKFTTTGFIHINIEPSPGSFNQQHQFLNIHIRDSGNCVEKQHVSMLFSPEHTGDRKISTEMPGAGISLYLSKKIAQELGGDISYVDDLEKGAHFVLHLNTGVALSERNAQESYGETLPLPTANRSLAGKRILLMDDVADIQMLYSTILKMAGAQVDVADNGKLGIDLANSHTYDIIIVDLKMPEIDGFETTRRLRTAGFKIPIIALTSYARPQERTLSIEAGCNDHISKPIGASQLVDKINSWLI